MILMIEKYFVKQSFKKIDLERFFAKHFAKAGFNSLSIIKTPVSTRLVISVAKPGIAIGYSGKTIKGIGKMIEEKYDIKNPQIEIKSVEDPEYNVKYIVQNIVKDLERGQNWKSVAFRAVKMLSDLPIMGFELIFKGKLMSKGGRKMKYRFINGYLKTVGNQTKLVKFAMAGASTKSGVIGVRLRLVPPNVLFPDKVGEKEIKEAIEKKVIVEVEKEGSKEKEIIDIKTIEKEVKNKEEKNNEDIKPKKVKSSEIKTSKENIEKKVVKEKETKDKKEKDKEEVKEQNNSNDVEKPKEISKSKKVVEKKEKTTKKDK